MTRSVHVETVRRWSADDGCRLAGFRLAAP
jgi:hypothetical protein